LKRQIKETCTANVVIIMANNMCCEIKAAIRRCAMEPGNQHKAFARSTVHFT